MTKISFLVPFLFVMFLVGCSNSSSFSSNNAVDMDINETWSIVTTTIQGKLVVYKVVNGLSNKNIREKTHWLTVISWKYNGSSKNGMPSNKINESMIVLEDGLMSIEGLGELYFNAYTATGNNLKEFVFYISDQEKFMENFNKALDGHSLYPLEINFYEDKEWSDLSRLQDDFRNTAKE